MLFHLITYILATIGLLNTIHYPVKSLLVRKPKALPEPVNYYNGIWLPEIDDPAWHHSVEAWPIQKWGRPYIIFAECMRLGDIQMAAWRNSVEEKLQIYLLVNGVFISQGHTNERIVEYRQLVENSYAQRQIQETLNRQKSLDG